jgi:predicted transposase/invertase (TIGR01784 family)
MKSTRSRRRRFLKTEENIEGNTGEYIPEDSFNRLNDAYFKYVLASPERKYLTINFINAVLSYQPPEGEEPVVIKDVEFLDRETVPSSEFDKIPRFDLFAQSTDGRYFHVEVQNIPEKHFTKRSLYYAFLDYTNQMRRGISYSELKPVIFIGIMNFNLFGDASDEKEWYTLHKFLNVKTHKNNFEDVEFHMLEIPVLRRHLRKSAVVPDSNLEKLLCFWSCKKGDKRMNALVDEIAEKNSDVADMLELERVFRMDPLMIRRYLIEERAHIDYVLNMKESREEGRKEGFSEAVKDSARRLRSQGILSDQQIADALDIPVEVVKTL